MSYRATFLFGLAGCFGFAAFGQTGGVGWSTSQVTVLPAPAARPAPMVTGGVMGAIVSTSGVASIPGAPYSAEELQEQVQTLGDGTHITNTPSASRFYRDSQGRVRTERTLGNGANAPVFVEITDPVASVRYSLDPANKIAHKWTMGEAGMVNRTAMFTAPPPPPPPLPPSAVPANRVAVPHMIVSSPLPQAAAAYSGAQTAQPEMTSENLGTQVMEGVTVQGTRRTITWPVGSMGNDRPITSTTETWTSPELKAVVFSKSNDPRSGENTMRLTHINRNEPDPMLFQPPTDYTVNDETANAARFIRN